MQKIRIIVSCAVFMCIAKISFSQSINWKTLQPEDRLVASATIGWEYGMIFGASYGYRLNSKLPILLNVTWSFPAGSKPLDDFKTKIGAQARLYKINNFQISASVYGIYRRYENSLVRLQNFGSEMAAVIGYYKPKGYIAGEIGFDKAIVTHFKHSESFRDHIYADVEDGWYEPPTGGNAFYGLQTGYSFPQSDLVFRIGRVITEDFKTNPLVPYYTTLGYHWKFR